MTSGVWDSRVRLGADELRIGRLPLIMGIVNATPDSFSDAGLYPTFDSRIEHARALLDAGADIIDVGGQSGITGTPEISVAEEIERVVPTIDYIVRELGALVSVDTYKPEVAQAAIEAGARIVNDVSGMRYPSIADVCAAGDAGLVIMHNRSAPKERLTDSDLYGDAGPLPDVLRFLRKRIMQAVSRGMPREALIIDPGLDFSKTPAQTVDVLRNLELLLELDRPLLLAISRKDFIGAITRRPPDQRLAGTLAALEHITGRVPAIVRVHDVAATSDFLMVLDALRGGADLDEDDRLAPELRRTLERTSPDET